MIKSSLIPKRVLDDKDYVDRLWNQFNTGSLPPYQISADADDNVTSYTYVTTNTDAAGISYISTNHYDANWSLIESAYTDSSGNNSVTQYQTSTDAEGNVKSYTYITTSTDAAGNSYTSTNRYDSNWKLTESAYSDSSGNTSVTQYQTSTDADGNVTSYTHITTNTDVNGNSYTSTNRYDSNWSLIQSAFTDSSGNNSVTQYQTSADADGNVTSYTYITTNTDAAGISYTSTNHYDSNWKLTETAYSDSSGNTSVTQYQTSTDDEGNVTSYTHITTSTDINGNSYTSTNHYDANWSLIESAYTDSSGNKSVTQYQTSADAEGNVTSYTHITTNTDAAGNSYTSTNHYDANWKLTESAYTDSSGNTSVTQYQTSTDADGNVTSYTHITTNTDAAGNSYTSTNHYDSNWKLTESAYSDSSGNTSVTQYQTSTDAEGNVTSYTHITTNTDANGNSYTSTNHYDSNWNLIESAYTDSSGNNSDMQDQSGTNADGNFEVCICFDLSTQGFEKLISVEDSKTENSTITSVVSESDYIAEIYALCHNSDYLDKNTVVPIPNVDLVGINNFVHTHASMI
jgi:hypothetical protein